MSDNASCITDTRVVQTRCANALARARRCARRCCTPSSDAAGRDEQSRRRTHIRGSHATLGRCLGHDPEIVRQRSRQQNATPTTQQCGNDNVEDTSVWWRSGCSSVGTQRSRAKRAETRKTNVQNAPTRRCTNSTDHNVLPPGLGSTRCRNQEDWWELNALKFGFAYVDRVEDAPAVNNVVWDTTAAKTNSNSLQAQPCLNPSGSRLFTVYVDKDFGATAVAQCMSKQICIITCWAACRLATRRNCKLSLVMTQPDRYF